MLHPTEPSSRTWIQEPSDLLMRKRSSHLANFWFLTMRMATRFTAADEEAAHKLDQGIALCGVNWQNQNMETTDGGPQE